MREFEHKLWPSIESFAHVLRGHRKMADKYGASPVLDVPYFAAVESMNGGKKLGRAISYQAKIKLHGTNAWFHKSVSGEWTAGKRSSKIDFPASDNAGFAFWFHSKIVPVVASRMSCLADSLHDVTVYGEWCGPGVQKGVACSGTKAKFFAVYAVLVRKESGEEVMIFEPNSIAEFVGDCQDLGVHVLPWHQDRNGTDVQIVDLEDQESLRTFVDDVNEDILSIEKIDPWIKDTFGVEGTGEGLVFYPVVANFSMRTFDYVFKAKGEEHRVVKSDRSVNVNVEKAFEANTLAQKLCTMARLEQLYIETFGDRVAQPNEIPLFLSAVGKDIMKECVLEIAESGLEWKGSLSSAVAKMSRDHLLARHKDSTT